MQSLHQKIDGIHPVNPEGRAESESHFDSSVHGYGDASYLRGMGTIDGYITRDDKSYAVKEITLEDNEINSKLLVECDINQYLKRYGHIDLKKWLKQIFNALAYLHKKGIIHRDIKPENIRVTPEGNIKLAGFESARGWLKDAVLSPKVTTLQYRAPELLLGHETYTSAIDLWSVGCIFWQIVMSTPLFDVGDGSDDGMQYQVFKKFGAPPEIECGFMPIDEPEKLAIEDKLEPEGIDLFKRLMRYEPTERITAEEALQHPFFL